MPRNQLASGQKPEKRQSECEPDESAKLTVPPLPKIDKFKPCQIHIWMLSFKLWDLFILLEFREPGFGRQRRPQRSSLRPKRS